MQSSRAERLRSIIEEEILSFKLRPGDKLDETKLAERFGTSRTPVREALRELSSNGLVEIRPHKGAIVTQIGIRDLVELFEVMAELEGACGRFAAKACFKSDIDVILEAQENCKRHANAGNILGYQRANEAFHDAIYLASRNSCLTKLTFGIRNRAAPYRRLLLDQPSRLKGFAEEHDCIANAIQDGQAEEADRLLQLHVLHLGVEVRRLISYFSTVPKDREQAEKPIHLGAFQDSPGVS